MISFSSARLVGCPTLFRLFAKFPLLFVGIFRFFRFFFGWFGFVGRFGCAGRFRRGFGRYVAGGLWIGRHCFFFYWWRPYSVVESLARWWFFLVLFELAWPLG